MIYDKREVFKKIEEEYLTPLRQVCTIAHIPFLCIFPTYDDGEQTYYDCSYDFSLLKNEHKEYACEGLTPGSMHIDLTDDLIKECIKILNGFKAVPNNGHPAITEHDFSVQNIIARNYQAIQALMDGELNDDYEDIIPTIEEGDMMFDDTVSRSDVQLANDVVSSEHHDCDNVIASIDPLPEKVLDQNEVDVDNDLLTSFENLQENVAFKGDPIE